MAVLYAYFDESGKFQNHDVVSFAGVCGDIRDMEVFSRKWREQLRRVNVSAFKMSDAVRYNTAWSDRVPAQTAAERRKALMPFIKCIADHTDRPVGIALDAKAFMDLDFKSRKVLGSPDDPQYVAFLRTVLLLGSREEEFFSLICDDEEKTAEPCYRFYRKVKKMHAERGRQLAKKMGCIGFADDKAFPPLQAADMFSSLVRLEADRLFFGKSHDFQELLEPLEGKCQLCFADRAVLQDMSDGLKKMDEANEANEKARRESS